MIRAILREIEAPGTGKTKTRRILKPQPAPFAIDDEGTPCEVTLQHVAGDPLPRIALGRVITRQEVRYSPGDLLWIRETWKPVHSADPSRGARYRADAGLDQTVWKPGIHMFRWASRITLDLTDVRVERLQDISEEDALAEGVEHSDEPHPLSGEVPHFHVDQACPDSTPVLAFFWLWQGINGTRPDCSWGDNPWVCVLSFRPHLQNIDALLAERKAA
jgi:hypothetical protein